MGVLDGRERAVDAGAVVRGQQSGRGGVVGDEDRDLAGMRGGQMEAEEGSEAASEHERGLIGEIGEKVMDVLGVGLGRDGRGRVYDLRPGQAPPVVSEHGVVRGQPVDEVHGAARVAVSALPDDQQRGVASDLVVQLGAGDGVQAGLHDVPPGCR
nr:hypothetical protein [Actinomadura fibrosa]